MKILKLFALCAIVVAVSCRSDNDAEEFEALLGHWHITSFEPESSSETALTAKEVIDQLVAAECLPLEFSFSSDGNVSHIDNMSFLEPVETENGVAVDCYFDNFFEVGSFTIRNDVLTLNYTETTEVLNVVLEEESLVIEKGSFILNGEIVSGKMIYTRQNF